MVNYIGVSDIQQRVREIGAADAIRFLDAVTALGLTSRGSGADNIRNVTGSPTAGIDPQELLDTRPYARSWHYHILNERGLYGLPRKFNVAFDGGGLGRRLSVYRLPEADWTRHATIEHAVTFPGGADLQVYVRVTQADGNQAWSSPIYLIA